MPPKHHSLPDDQFIDFFETGRLKPEWISHEAHIRMAWPYLNQKTLSEALSAISKGIRQMDSMYSGGMKCHHTITIAFSLIIYSLIIQGNDGDWKTFIAKNPELTDAKKLLTTYYSEEIITSLKAKQIFIAPDLCPLPPYPSE